MKALKIAYIFLFASLLGNYAFSQSPITKINRNINSTAKGLSQELNATNDTLNLKYDKEILRVSFLSHNKKKTVEVDIASKQVNIPLYHFAEGRYTIAVYTEDLIIAFDINRLLPIVKEKGSIDDLEESTLRASLTNKELVDRNMEPSKNDIVAQDHSKSQSLNKNKTLVKKETNQEQKVEVVAINETKQTEDSNTKENKNLEEDAKNAKLVSLRNGKMNNNSDVSSNDDVLDLELSENKGEDRTKNLLSRQKVQRVKTEKEIKPAYNLSVITETKSDKQSREEYRKNHLRPNGKKYD